MAELPEFLRRLEAMASPEWRERLARRMAERTLDLIDHGYRDRRDPYGSPWPATKQPNPILDKTGAYRRSWTPTRVNDQGFTVAANGVDYAMHHHRGTARIVPRITVPLEGGGLGNWQEPLEQEAIAAIVEVMKP